MLTSNTVSYHKSYFDMQNVFLSELHEIISYYPEGFRIWIVNFKTLKLGYLFQSYSTVLFIDIESWPDISLPT